MREQPLYQQLYQDLRSRVQTGEYKPGDLFPAESELMRDYGVSRITIRSALDHLVKDGFLERFPGKGSFVKASEPETLNCLMSFTDQMLSQGRKPVTKLLALKQLKARDLTQNPFENKEKLVLIERLRLVDAVAAALVRSYLPRKLVPGISRKHFEETGRGQSLLYVLEHHFGLVLDKGEETLLPAYVNLGDAHLLAIADGAAVILKACLVRNIMAEPVLYEEALWSVPQTQQVRRRTVAYNEA